MSNNVNTELLERAAEMVEYWTGTLHEKLILKALDSNDLEEVRRHVVNAEAEAARREIYGYDLMPESDTY